jgi:hypothetical protein
MTPGFAFLRRVAGLSAAIAMFVSTVEAQTPAASSEPGDQSTNSALLSQAAFAKLARVPAPRVVSAPEPKDPPRQDLLRQGTAAATRAAALAPKPPRRSSGWGQKTVVVLALVGLVVGVAAASFYTGVDFFPILDALFGGK